MNNPPFRTERWPDRSLWRPTLVLVWSLTVSAGSDGTHLTPREPLEAGLDLMRRGEFGPAAKVFQRTAEGFKASNQSELKLEALLHLSAAYQSLGHPKLALRALTNALPLANQSPDPSRLTAIHSALGTMHTILRNADASSEGDATHLELARAHLDQGLELAEEANDRLAMARLLNNSGNWHAAQGKYAEATQHYQESGRMALDARDSLTAARSFANAARVSILNRNLTGGESFNREALKQLELLEASHDQSSLYTSIGLNYQSMASRNPERKASMLSKAAQAFQTARAVAEQTGSQRALSYALGYLGTLSERESRHDEALLLTRKALFSAQQADALEVAYQWEWQSARLLAAMHETDAAIAGYRRAVDTFQGIRHDLALGYGNQSVDESIDPEGFAQGTGAVFFDLADLLFRKADSLPDPSQIQDCLGEIREVIETLRSAELEDYFRDECVNLARSRSIRVEAVSTNTAVLYVVPFHDRIELLVGISRGTDGVRFRRFKTSVTRRELHDTVRSFRFLLEKRTTEEFRDPAQKLYHWLIAPLAPALAAQRIDTLILVPDGALRSIPLGALHDGDHFLVEQFSLAVTPGLTLLDARPIPRKHVSILLGALSEGVSGFRPLEFVNEEVRNVRQAYSAATVLTNQHFTMGNLTRSMSQGRFPVVHLASHGEFESNSKNSFILTYDARLRLNDLEKMIRPKQYRGQPVELLVLSACQTAGGDDRAALGLAGIAVKSGARSALATLWYVNDEAAARLVSEFYFQIRRDPDISKAKALQAAQVQLLRARQYEHPCYWSPFLIIGNWR